MRISCMILTLFVNSCLGHSYTVDCGDVSDDGLVFEPSKDGVGGRYELRWCTNISAPHVDLWTLHVYVDDRPPEKCVHFSIRDRITLHSKLEEKINQTWNCDRVCLSTRLDLVYGGCYSLKNELRVGGSRQELNMSLRYARSNYTHHMFNKLRTIVAVTDQGDKSLVTIHNNYIPLEDFYLNLCCDSHCDRDVEVDSNCSKWQSSSSEARTQWAAQCHIWSGGREGDNCSVWLAHTAPWVHGDAFADTTKDVLGQFVPRGQQRLSATPERGGGGGGAAAWWLWAAGGALCVSVAALFVLYLRRKDADSWRKHVLSAWKDRLVPVPPAPPATPAVRPVLLLYARDSSYLNGAMDTLARLIETHTGAQVLDVYSPRVVSLCAGSPVSWLRAQLHSAKVVFIQTHLCSARYTDNIHDATVRAPLSASTAARSAQLGDALLQYAVRAVSLDLSTDLYSRYYICTLSALPVEMFKHVCPFRRYALPDALHLLLRDVNGRHDAFDDVTGRHNVASDVTAETGRLRDESVNATEAEKFRKALSDHELYVRSNQEYVQDELLMF